MNINDQTGVRVSNYEPFNIPENGKEQLQIADLSFEFIEEQWKATIFFNLNLTLAAKTSQNKPKQRLSLIHI